MEFEYVPSEEGGCEVRVQLIIGLRYIRTSISEVLSVAMAGFVGMLLAHLGTVRKMLAVYIILVEPGLSWSAGLLYTGHVLVGIIE